MGNPDEEKGSVAAHTTSVGAEARGSQTVLVSLIGAGLLIVLAALAASLWSVNLVVVIALLVGIACIGVGFYGWTRSFEAADKGLHPPPPAQEVSLAVGLADGTSIAVSGSSTVGAFGHEIFDLLRRVHMTKPLPPPVGRISEPSDTNTAVRYDREEAEAVKQEIDQRRQADAQAALRAVEDLTTLSRGARWDEETGARMSGRTIHVFDAVTVEELGKASRDCE